MQVLNAAFQRKIDVLVYNLRSHHACSAIKISSDVIKKVFQILIVHLIELKSLLACSTEFFDFQTPLIALVVLKQLQNCLLLNRKPLKYH